MCVKDSVFADKCITTSLWIIYDNLLIALTIYICNMQQYQHAGSRLLLQGQGVAGGGRNRFA